MPTTETKIWKALSQRVRALPGGYVINDGDDPEFVRPSDASGPLPYVEADNIPNESDRITIGSDDADDRRGILTLTLMYPVSAKKNRDFLREQGGLIAAHFPKDLKLRFDTVTVRIEVSPRVVDPYRDGAYWRIPVTIRWQTSDQ